MNPFIKDYFDPTEDVLKQGLEAAILTANIEQDVLPLVLPENVPSKLFQLTEEYKKGRLTLYDWDALIQSNDGKPLVVVDFLWDSSSAPVKLVRIVAKLSSIVWKDGKGLVP